MRRSANRGLKPTATIITSLRDGDTPESIPYAATVAYRHAPGWRQFPEHALARAVAREVDQHGEAIAVGRRIVS